MPQKKRGLGRGLGALIPTETQAVSEEPTQAPLQKATDVDVRVDVQLTDVPARFVEVPPSAVVPNPRQPRQVFDEDAMAELVHSIREIGLLQPIVVRATDNPAVFELVAGERRWRASQLAGLELIPAIVRQTADDQLLRDALLENLHRSALNPLEEAAAYQQLLDDFDCTQEELAVRIGRSRPQVTNTIRLLKLPPPVARRVAAGVLSAGHARAILSLDDDEAMERMAQRVVAEGLSVRAVEEIVTIGDGTRPARTRKPRGARVTPVEVVDLVDRLSDRLDTRVSADAGSGKGRITIEYASIDDLRRIVEIIDDNSN